MNIWAMTWIKLSRDLDRFLKHVEGYLCLAQTNSEPQWKYKYANAYIYPLEADQLDTINLNTHRDNNILKSYYSSQQNFNFDVL